MITASEARTKIAMLDTKRGKEEQLIAEEVITKTIEKGKYNCRLGFEISDDAKKWLESLGYCVNYVAKEKPDNGIEFDTAVAWW